MTELGKHYDDFAKYIALKRNLEEEGIRIFNTEIVNPRKEQYDNMDFDEKVKFHRQSTFLDFSNFKCESYGFKRKGE